MAKIMQDIHSTDARVLAKELQSQAPLTIIPTTDEDLFNIPGLIETVRLWMAERALKFHNSEHVSAETIAGYTRWRQSGGYENPCVDSASVGADYLKIRSALEAFPIDPSLQLAALFCDRTGDIRQQQRPPKEAFIATGEKTVFEMLGVTDTKLGP